MIFGSRRVIGTLPNGRVSAASLFALIRGLSVSICGYSMFAM